MAIYKVYLSGRAKIAVEAGSADEAKSKAWNEIKDFYTYGWKNKKEFMEGATAKRVATWQG